MSYVIIVSTTDQDWLHQMGAAKKRVIIYVNDIRAKPQFVFMEVDRAKIHIYLFMLYAELHTRPYIAHFCVEHHTEILD